MVALTVLETEKDVSLMNIATELSKVLSNQEHLRLVCHTRCAKSHRCSSPVADELVKLGLVNRGADGLQLSQLAIDILFENTNASTQLEACVVKDFPN